MIEKQSIMVVAAHADDNEVIAGGTMRKYYEQGYEIIYVMSTNNMSGANSTLGADGKIVSVSEPPEIMSARRKSECDAAAALVGTKPIHLDHPQRHYRDAAGKFHELRYGCALPPGVPAGVPSILTAYEDAAAVKRLTDLILQRNPACIITMGMGTNNIEHAATAMLAVKCFWQAVDKGFRGAMIQGREDYTSFGDVNAKWDTFVDISDYVDKKMEMLAKHRCQMPTAHEPDHGHRLRVLKWGVACGCKAAEVFTWVRRYDRPDLDARLLTYSPLIAELMHHSR